MTGLQVPFLFSFPAGLLFFAENEATLFSRLEYGKEPSSSEARLRMLCRIGHLFSRAFQPWSRLSLVSCNHR